MGRPRLGGPYRFNKVESKQSYHYGFLDFSLSHQVQNTTFRKSKYIRIQSYIRTGSLISRGARVLPKILQRGISHQCETHTLNTGAKIPTIGFGTFQDKEQQEGAVLQALKTGFGHIDTARVYDFSSFALFQVIIVEVECLIHLH